MELGWMIRLVAMGLGRDMKGLSSLSRRAEEEIEERRRGALYLSCVF